MKLVALVGAFVSFGVLAIRANPVDLSPPENSIGSADPYGHLRVWREIDEVDFGEGFTLPFRAEFSSETVESSYAGSGWWLPFLEAKAHLKRENMLQATLICGKSMFLRRDKNDPAKFLTLDKEWTGRFEKDDIIISREDGWELRYRNGLIFQLKTDKNRLFTWMRNGNLVTEVREEGNAFPQVRLMASSNGSLSGIEINGRSHKFHLEGRPIVQSVGGKTLIGAIKPALSSWQWPDGSKETYSYEARSENGALLPCLALGIREGGTEEFSWDPATRTILSDGAWKYFVGKISGEFDLPRIERKNKAGVVEFLQVDNRRGITEQKTVENGHRVSEVFKSPGPLFGKVRKIDLVGDNGKARTIYRANYDEFGKILRETNADGRTTVYEWAENGKLKNRRILQDLDGDALVPLRETEQALLKEIAAAASASERNDKLQELGFLYIHKISDPQKALALLGQMTDPQQIYNLKLHSIAYNLDFSYEDKVHGYARLLEEFPAHKEQIDWMINQTRKMAKK